MQYTDFVMLMLATIHIRENTDKALYSYLKLWITTPEFQAHDLTERVGRVYGMFGKDQAISYFRSETGREPTEAEYQLSTQGRRPWCELPVEKKA